MNCAPPLTTWNDCFVALHSPELQSLRREHGYGRALRALGAAYRDPRSRVLRWGEWRTLVIELGLLTHSSTVGHHEGLFVGAARELRRRRNERRGAVASAAPRARAVAALLPEDLPSMFGVLALALVKWDAPPFAAIGHYRHRHLALLAFKSLVAGLSDRLRAARERRARSGHAISAAFVTVTQQFERLKMQMYRKDGATLLDYEEQIAALVVAPPAEEEPRRSPLHVAAAAAPSPPPHDLAPTPARLLQRRALAAGSPPAHLTVFSPVAGGGAPPARSPLGGSAPPRAAPRAATGEKTVSVLSFMYRYILHESCSQFDSLPLTSLTVVKTVRAVGDIYVRLDALRAERVACESAFVTLNEGAVPRRFWRDSFAAAERRLKRARGAIKAQLLPLARTPEQRTAGGGLTAIHLEMGLSYLLHARTYALRTTLIGAARRSVAPPPAPGSDAALAAENTRNARLALLLERAAASFRAAQVSFLLFTVTFRESCSH